MLEINRIQFPEELKNIKLRLRSNKIIVILLVQKQGVIKLKE